MIVKNAEEAARILVELAQTDQMYSLHFEFDAYLDSAPKIEYTVKRYAFPTQDEEDG